MLIPRYFIYLALGGWFIVSVGLIHSFVVKKPETSRINVE